MVGTRTWGGVISCYFNELVDGTLVTQPTSALLFAGVGLAVENHGVDPDVEGDNRAARLGSWPRS